MKSILHICLVFCVLGASSVAGAQSAQERAPDAGTVRNDGIPLERIIAAVAKKTGKKYLVDARAHGQAEIFGQDISSITYADLLSILQMYGFTAVEGSTYISVIPESNIRQMPLPLASGKDSYPDAQYVNSVIAVKNVPAALLVPILRPLLPVHGHLAAMPCGNYLLMTDSFANTKRTEKIIASLDVGTPYVPHPCEAPAPAHP
jgi:type II secretory pathway component GspD/PulD (secretin)